MITPDEINAMLDELWPSVEVRCVELGPDHALARLVPAESDIRPGGVISGPTQFGIADSAFWFLVSGALGRLEPMAVTSELSIRYLRPATGEELFARADLERLGRRNVVATVRVYTGSVDAPTAVAQGTYFVPQPSAKD